MSKIMSNEEIDRTIEGLLNLIEIYSVELYELDHKRPRDLMAEYRWQLRVDKTYEVIDELRRYKNSK